MIIVKFLAVIITKFITVIFCNFHNLGRNLALTKMRSNQRLACLFFTQSMLKQC